MAQSVIIGKLGQKPDFGFENPFNFIVLQT